LNTCISAQNDVAVQTIRGEITWKALLSSVRSVALTIREAQFVPEQAAVTVFDNPVRDWIVTLALMHEALVSCSAFGNPPSHLKADVILGPATLGQQAVKPRSSTMLS
jgi:hypothetical protein